jgi:deoxyribonuclease-1
MNERLKAQGYTGAARAAMPLPMQFSCVQRKTCGQMVSCDEAQFHLNECGNRKLDGNRDGVACESVLACR